MKKAVIFIVILGSILGAYQRFGYLLQNQLSSLKEKQLKIEKNTSAQLEELYIYGRNLHIKGNLNLEQITPIEIKLLLYNNNFQTYHLDYEIHHNQLLFWLGDKLNNGPILDNIALGKYYLFIEVDYSSQEGNPKKYYPLTNQTTYQKTNYYTLKSINHKIQISKESSYPTMILEVSKNQEKSIYDIVIDPGHGGKDSGAINGNYKESTLTYEVASLLKKKLEKLGFSVKLTHNGNIPLDEVMDNYNSHGRAIIPQKVKAKYLFSLHLNSSTASYVNGLEIYTANQIDNTLAKQLAENLVNDTGLNYSTNKSYKITDGVYTRNFTEKEIQESTEEMKKKGQIPYPITTNSNYFFMIRETGGIMTGAYIDDKNPQTVGINPYFQSNVGVESYILELGFITNHHDLENFITNKERYANSIAKTIQQHCTFS